MHSLSDYFRYQNTMQRDLKDIINYEVMNGKVSEKEVGEGEEEEIEVADENKAVKKMCEYITLRIDQLDSISSTQLK